MVQQRQEPGSYPMNRTLAREKDIPHVPISWTKRELVSLARLISSRPAEPAPSLMRAMKEEA